MAWKYLRKRSISNPLDYLKVGMAEAPGMYGHDLVITRAPKTVSFITVGTLPYTMDLEQAQKFIDMLIQIVHAPEVKVLFDSLDAKAIKQSDTAF